LFGFLQLLLAAFAKIICQRGDDGGNGGVRCQENSIYAFASTRFR